MPHINIQQFRIELGADGETVELHYLVNNEPKEARFYDKAILHPDVACILGAHMLAKAGACYAKGEPPLEKVAVLDGSVTRKKHPARKKSPRPKR